MSHINSFDVNASRKEYYVCISVAASLVKDQRDAPIAYLLGNILIYFCIAIPLLFHVESHVAGLVHFLAVFIFFYERFVLALHYLTHRPVFSNSLLNFLPEFLLGPAFGIPFGLYSTHHLVVHHVEGNIAPGDLSSTEYYQRDNPAHFLLYWARFLLFSLIELPVYALRRGRYDLFLRIACSCVAIVYLYTFLLHRYFAFALWVLMVPTVVGSFFLMLGNWSQHIFINPNLPDTPYGITYDIINSPTNQRTFNDGYHIQHHLNSKRHWTQLPVSFQEHQDEMATHDCIVFSGLSFVEVGLCVFLRRYDKLAAHFVDIRNRNLKPCQIEEILRARLRPVHRWNDGCALKQA